jgi:hypothetical protein
VSDRPQEINKGHVYGNFRQRNPGKRRKNSDKIKKREGNSERHLACIRKLPCCVTLAMPGGEAHHLKAETGTRGGAMRSVDKFTVPMAHDPHMEVENVGTRNEIAWFRERGVDPLILAADLWKATGDVARMTEVLIGHRKHFKHE